MIRDINCKEKRCGPGRRISIPISCDLQLTGEVWATKIRLGADADLPEVTVNKLLDVLRAFGTARVIEWPHPK